MGLLSIIRKAKLKERQMRILMLGLDNAGKTTICRKLLGEDIDHIEPTLGFNIRTLMVKGYSLNIWDIGGQKSLRAFWRNYFETTDGVIWVIDSGDTTRMRDVKAELLKLLQEERLSGASLLILANKQDLNSALDVAKISELLGLSELKTHPYKVVPCSVYQENGNIQGGLDWLMTDISSKMYYTPGKKVGSSPEEASSSELPLDELVLEPALKKPTYT